MSVTASKKYRIWLLLGFILQLARPVLALPPAPKFLELNQETLNNFAETHPIQLKKRSENFEQNSDYEWDDDNCIKDEYLVLFNSSKLSRSRQYSKKQGFKFQQMLRDDAEAVTDENVVFNHLKTVFTDSLELDAIREAFLNHNDTFQDSLSNSSIKAIWKLSGYHARLTLEQLAVVQADPYVKAVEKNCLVQISSTNIQSNPGWALDRLDQPYLQFDNSYDYGEPGYRGEGVDIYILDSPVDINHPEFEGRARDSGFVPWLPTSDGNPVDHGSHVASLAAGATYGVAKLANIIQVQTLNVDGDGTLSSILGAIEWVVNDHQKKMERNNGTALSIINMSLGMPRGIGSSILQDFVDYALNFGIHFAVASGNENVDACTTAPSFIPRVITVGAINSQDDEAFFSNYGTCVDILAPGVQVNGLYFGRQVALSGTSMATPIVTGAIARLLSQEFSLPEATRDRLLSAAARNQLSTSNARQTPNILVQSNRPAISIDIDKRKSNETTLFFHLETSVLSSLLPLNLLIGSGEGTFVMGPVPSKIYAQTSINQITLFKTNKLPFVTGDKFTLQVDLMDDTSVLYSLTKTWTKRDLKLTLGSTGYVSLPESTSKFITQFVGNDFLSNSNVVNVFVPSRNCMSAETQLITDPVATEIIVNLKSSCFRDSKILNGLIFLFIETSMKEYQFQALVKALNPPEVLLSCKNCIMDGSFANQVNVFIESQDVTSFGMFPSGDAYFKSFDLGEDYSFTDGDDITISYPDSLVGDLRLRKFIPYSPRKLKFTSTLAFQNDSFLYHEVFDLAPINPPLLIFNENQLISVNSSKTSISIRPLNMFAASTVILEADNSCVRMSNNRLTFSAQTTSPKKVEIWNSCSLEYLPQSGTVTVNTFILMDYSASIRDALVFKQQQLLFISNSNEALGDTPQLPFSLNFDCSECRLDGRQQSHVSLKFIGGSECTDTDSVFIKVFDFKDFHVDNVKDEWTGVPALKVTRFPLRVRYMREGARNLSFFAYAECKGNGKLFEFVHPLQEIILPTIIIDQSPNNSVVVGESSVTFSLSVSNGFSKTYAALESSKPCLTFQTAFITLIEDQTASVNLLNMCTDYSAVDTEHEVTVKILGDAEYGVRDAQVFKHTFSIKRLKSSVPRIVVGDSKSLVLVAGPATIIPVSLAENTRFAANTSVVARFYSSSKYEFQPSVFHFQSELDVFNMTISAIDFNFEKENFRAINVSIQMGEMNLIQYISIKQGVIPHLVFQDVNGSSIGSLELKRDLMSLDVQVAIQALHSLLPASLLFPDGEYLRFQPSQLVVSQNGLFQNLRIHRIGSPDAPMIQSLPVKATSRQGLVNIPMAIKLEPFSMAPNIKFIFLDHGRLLVRALPNEAYGMGKSIHLILPVDYRINFNPTRIQFNLSNAMFEQTVAVDPKSFSPTNLRVKVILDNFSELFYSLAFKQSRPNAPSAFISADNYIYFGSNSTSVTSFLVGMHLKLGGHCMIETKNPGIQIVPSSVYLSPTSCSKYCKTTINIIDSLSAARSVFYRESGLTVSCNFTQSESRIAIIGPFNDTAEQLCSRIDLSKCVYFDPFYRKSIITSVRPDESYSKILIQSVQIDDAPRFSLVTENQKYALVHVSNHIEFAEIISQPLPIGAFFEMADGRFKNGNCVLSLDADTIECIA